MNKRFLILLTTVIFVLACNIGSSTPPPQSSSLFLTLSASTPVTGTPAWFSNETATPTSAFNLATVGPTLFVPTSALTNQPTGKIVFTCQVFKIQASNQICIINADGTGFRRLTTDDSRQHYYASLSPDGQSVVYAAFREANIYEIYEMNLSTGNVVQLTNRIGIVNGPEISPDGNSIVFKNTTVNSGRNLIMLMDRNGKNVNNIPNATGWDPTWSPDGKYILFASDMEGTVQLYTIRVNGKELKKISSLPAIRGRSDMSADGRFIVTY